MCNKIINQQYNIDLPDDEPFYFNIKEDSEGNVLIQNGSELKHAHIMLTSKKLMANCERQGMIHIDGTYKLVKFKLKIKLSSINILSLKKSFKQKPL